MKNRLLISGLSSVIMTFSLVTQAQTYTLDWGASFIPAWAAGNTTGTATNIGGSGVNCTANIVRVGSGALVAPYPRVNNNNGQGGDFEVQASTDAIEIDINLGNKTSFYNISFTFSTPVRNIAFGISDIDRPNGASPWTYSDYVTITGTGPGGPCTPTLSLYNPASTIVNIAANTASANNGGGGGNVTSLNQGTPDQNGTIFVNFGATLISVITIQYGTQNIAQVNNDPGLEAISVGNLSFQLPGTLPITLYDFKGVSKDQKTLLSWSTLNEVNACCFEVEHSIDNQNFTTIGTINSKGAGNQRTDYAFIHHSPVNGANYYRLKLMDIDRSFSYSKTIVVSIKFVSLTINRLANPFTGTLNAQINCPMKCNLQIQIIDMNGRLLYRKYFADAEGSIQFSVPESARFAAGQYILWVSDGKDLVKQPLIKL